MARDGEETVTVMATETETEIASQIEPKIEPTIGRRSTRDAAVVALIALIALLAVLAPAVVARAQPAQQTASAGSASVSASASAPEQKPFRIGGEIKFNFRDSADAEALVSFPFPPNFLPPGQTQVFERTTSKGASLELSNFALIGEG